MNLEHFSIVGAKLGGGGSLEGSFFKLTHVGMPDCLQRGAQTQMASSPLRSGNFCSFPPVP